ncbi:MAG: hypothetical protein QUS07_07190 [Methanothrix sp.]|nr:hypothetical protein [Methanothrix sp.]
MDESLQQLIGLVRNLSPELWRIALLQNGNKATLDLVFGGIGIVLSIVVDVIYFRHWKEIDSTSTIIAWVIMIILYLFTLTFLGEAWLRFSNPEYYALDYLLSGICWR